MFKLDDFNSFDIDDVFSDTKQTEFVMFFETSEYSKIVFESKLGCYNTNLDGFWNV